MIANISACGEAAMDLSKASDINHTIVPFGGSRGDDLLGRLHLAYPRPSRRWDRPTRRSTAPLRRIRPSSGGIRFAIRCRLARLLYTSPSWASSLARAVHSSAKRPPTICAGRCAGGKVPLRSLDVSGSLTATSPALRAICSSRTIL